MTRINPDPYAGGHLFALVNRVTGLLENDDAVAATVRALEENGIASDDIDIFKGEQGAKRLDLSGREHGRAVRLLRTLEAAVGDEAATNQRINEALHRGATLLCIKVHNLHRKDSFPFVQKSDEKARALKVLKEGHAHEIHYWGPWAFEDVPSS